jgi:hypothetical protein
MWLSVSVRGSTAQLTPAYASHAKRHTCTWWATEAWGWHQAGTTDCMTGQTTCLARLTRLSRTCTYMSRHRTCTDMSSTATTLNARAPQSPRAPQGPRDPHRPECRRQRRLLADGLYVESSQRLPLAWPEGPPGPEGPPVRVQLQSPPHTVKSLRACTRACNHTGLHGPTSC